MEQELISFIRFGDTIELGLLLDSGLDPNYKINDFFKTPIIKLACYYDQYEIGRAHV